MPKIDSGPYMVPEKFLLQDRRLGQTEAGDIVYSRVYDLETVILKQGPGDVCVWEKKIVDQLQGPDDGSPSMWPEVYSAGINDGWSWMLMEKVDGITLENYLCGGEVMRRIVVRLRAILHWLRQSGVQHRDIQPSNLIVCNSRKVVLIDYQWATAPGMEVEVPKEINPVYGRMPPDDEYSIEKIIEELR